MIAVDTCILARWILRDDPEQFLAAQAIVEEPFIVTLPVLLELGWVIGTRAGQPRAAVVAAMSGILQLDTAHVVEEAGIAWAIDRYGDGADWGDVINIVASATTASAFLTFDRKLARRAGRDAPLPVRIVGSA